LRAEDDDGVCDRDGCAEREGGVVCVIDEPVLEPIAFPMDSEIVDSAVLYEVESAAHVLLFAASNISELYVVGFASSDEHNSAALARGRAERVRERLIAIGVDPSRLVVDLDTSAVPVPPGGRGVSFRVGTLSSALEPVPAFEPSPEPNCPEPAAGCVGE
jgi:hypothetical protein